MLTRLKARLPGNGEVSSNQCPWDTDLEILLIKTSTDIRFQEQKDIGLKLDKCIFFRTWLHLINRPKDVVQEN